MARAIIKGNRIVKLTTDPTLGVEVGMIPKGVGFERLRWDGEQLIDLADLTEFYISRNNFKLHIQEQPNTDLVEMNYQDRHKLMFDTATNKVRLKTQQEIDQPKNDEYKARRRSQYPPVGDQLGAIMDYLKTQPGIGSKLEQIIADIDEVKVKWPKL